jgi:FtsP/CotA-like multicopper oxidase with cupredoxin domain
MTPTRKPRRLRWPLLALTIGAVLAAPSSAADFYLVAKQFSKTFPGSATPVVMWGFAADSDGDLSTDGAETPSSPGPRLTIPVGDTSVNIHVRNDLAEPISIVIPGLVGSGDPTWTDGTSGPRSSASQRVRSLTHETAPGGIGDYTWSGMRPGTLLYLSGTHQSVQVQMGLYGGLTQDEAAGEAYPGIPYSKEVVLFYSEVDPALHGAVAGGTYGTAPYTSSYPYVPEYFLVNGEPYPNGTPTFTGLNVNDRVLVRLLNAGLKTRVPAMLGSYLSVIAEDGSTYAYPKQQYEVMLAAGKTSDAVFAPVEAGTYPVFDRRLALTNAGAADGGLLAFLDVTAGAAAPVAMDDTYSIAEDTALVVAAPGVLANDSGGGALTAALVSTTANGTLTLAADGSLTYTPNADFAGTDLFTYKANDGVADSNLASVGITVTPVNDAPVTVADAYESASGVALNVAAPGVLANDTDVDGDALTAVLVSGPSSASSFALNADGSFSYTSAGCSAVPIADSFTYAANDGTVSGAAANAAINVAAWVNQAPVAANDNVSLTQNTTVTIPVLANDSDPDAGCSGGLNAASVTIASGPNRGATASVNPATGAITYTPKKNFRGTDFITYTVRDNAGAESNAATVRINVTR